ncbi:MAG: heme o synthase [Phycisphaerales bacterium JB050]
MAQFDQSVMNPAIEANASRKAVLREQIAAVIELSKPGIVRMVVIATAVGYIIGSIGAVPDLWVACFCLIGTALSAAGANALNMAAEVERDLCMRRTASRPIPGGRLSRRAGYSAGIAFSIAGVTMLWFGATPAAAVVSLATILSYVLFYTPLKAVTPLSTLVGAIPGALPPLVGWAAASGAVVANPEASSWLRLLDPGGWSLFALMFVWQVPHVMAISWKYRDDYEAGGYRVLPSVDPTGLKTARASVIWAATLIPVSILPAVTISLRTVEGEASVLGLGYVLIAALCGLVMFWSTVEFLRERTNKRALIVFIVSILYLPAVLAAMLIDAFIVHRLW